MMRRFSDTSMSLSFTCPNLTAFGMFLYTEPQLLSVPARMALPMLSSDVLVNMWVVWKSRMAPQSLTTSPLKPHSLRSIWCRYRVCPQQGMESMRW